MSDCKPEDLNLNLNPPASTAPNIPGFGVPSSPITSSPAYPTGFPEDLRALFDSLSVILPPGSIKGPLTPNAGKQVIDGVLKILDQLSPFLLVYKFILPVLNLVVCIIEVLCAIPNPFKVIRALKRLFRNCLPQFLALFPAFALPVLIISLLELIIQLFTYLKDQISKLVTMLLKNVAVYQNAIKTGDATQVKAAATKFAQILCSFQNYFVVLLSVSSIIQTVKDILSLLNLRLPCRKSDDCCDPSVCPAFISQGSFTSTGGNLRYINQVVSKTNISSTITRQESWSFFDARTSVPQVQAFSNIYDAYDITESPKTIFFPEITYTKESDYQKSPYTLDLKFEYDPSLFGKVGIKRFVIVRNVMMAKKPNNYVLNKDSAKISKQTGVLSLVGGQAFEVDGITPIMIDGNQATLDVLITKASQQLDFTNLNTSDDGPVEDVIDIAVEYIFDINHEALYAANLITAGCIPEIAIDSQFLDSIFTSTSAINLAVLTNLQLPDYSKVVDCLNVGLTDLRQNINPDGISQFSSLITTCIDKAINDSQDAINQLIPTAIDLTKSDFTIYPKVQFTNKNILVKVTLNDAYGNNVFKASNGRNSEIVANQLSATITSGFVTNFTYNKDDASFEALIQSKEAITGDVSILYNGSYISTVTYNTDLTQDNSTSIKKLPYMFMAFGESGNDQGELSRRDESDVSNG